MLNPSQMPAATFRKGTVANMVRKISAPAFLSELRFEYHPMSQKVYVIFLATGKNELIADQAYPIVGQPIHDLVTAELVIGAWLMGYRTGKTPIITKESVDALGK